MTGNSNIETALAALLENLEQKYPICCASIRDARAKDPEAFLDVGQIALAGALHCFPDKTVEDLGAWYAEFTVEQNRLQRSYDKTGSYPCRNHGDANEAVYQSDESMGQYMASMLLTEFLWPHHLEIFEFYRKEFIANYSGIGKSMLEIAPGHGLLGRVLMEKCPQSTLTGVDISPFAVKMSRRMAAMHPQVHGATYEVGDGVRWEAEKSYDLIVAGELLEHLDRPELLIQTIRRCLKPGGRAFVTAAITAAQMDHVTEFKSPEEVVELITSGGLEIETSLVAQPRVVRAGSTRIPRVMAAIVRVAEPVSV